jgi:hypothetical protein
MTAVQNLTRATQFMALFVLTSEMGFAAALMLHRFST